MVWNLCEPRVLHCQFFGGMDLKIKGKKGGMMLLELLKPWESWDQAVRLLMRQRVKLGPSCRAHQSLRKSKTALGDVLIRPAHKNTELWPLKPFLFLDFSHSLLSLLHLGDWGQHMLLFHLRAVEPELYPIPALSPAWIHLGCFLECWTLRSQLLFNAEWKCWC